MNLNMPGMLAYAHANGLQNYWTVPLGYKP